ncbi:MAG: hypothetical protein ACYCQM_08675 [Acidithiobacillus sp.]
MKNPDYAFKQQAYWGYSGGFAGRCGELRLCSAPALRIGSVGARLQGGSHNRVGNAMRPIHIDLNPLPWLPC